MVLPYAEVSEQDSFGLMVFDANYSGAVSTKTMEAVENPLAQPYLACSQGFQRQPKTYRCVVELNCRYLKNCSFPKAVVRRLETPSIMDLQQSRNSW